MNKPFRTKENISLLKKEAKQYLKRTPRLDEKRIAIRQFIEEGSKITNNRYDLIVAPLFSGFIPAELLKELYFIKNKKRIPIFYFNTISCLGEKNYAIEKGKYKINFTESGEKIINIIKKDFEKFLNKNKLDKNIKILFIDANVAKAFTIAYFTEVLKRINYNFSNLTVTITDSRAEKKDIYKLPEKLFKGGRFITFNQRNMTNKVFDNVLTPSCNLKSTEGYKKFDGKKMIYSEDKITYFSYFIALEIFREELIDHYWQ